MALDKPLEQLTETDLKSLVGNRIAELKTLEYKRQLPDNSEADRKEFLADVSSFANAAGGQIIYGMKEEQGIPVEVAGLDSDADKAILALESRIRDGVAPRIPGVHSFAIKLADQKAVIVLRVPTSYASPHMVTLQRWSRFFSRTSKGKYQLDVHEIRSAFLASETTADRIRDFRLERISRILSGDTPIPIEEGAKMVLHIVPLAAFVDSSKIDTSSINTATACLQFAPIMKDFANDKRINFDGIVSFHGSDSYCQVYRSGIIETVDQHFLCAFGNDGSIPGLYLEVHLFQSVRRLLASLRNCGVEAPLMVMLSLLGVRERMLVRGNNRGFSFPTNNLLTDRNDLIAESVLVESFDTGIPEAMRTAVNSIWNGFGYPGSPFYTDGKWIGEEAWARIGGSQMM